jgi:RNA polymerase sigma factor (sigma-70 family)
MESGTDVYTTSSRDENVVFAEYQKAAGADKERLAAELAKMLIRHAIKVCWLELKEYRPDIANSAAFRAIEKAESFKGASKFSTWFHRIVLNQCKSQLRKRLQLAEVSLDAIEHTGEEPAFAPHHDAHLDYMGMMEGLTQREQQLLQWKLEGRGEDFLAEQMRLKRTGVRHAWWRLRRKLMRKMGSGTA